MEVHALQPQLSTVPHPGCQQLGIFSIQFATRSKHGKLANSGANVTRASYRQKRRIVRISVLSLTRCPSFIENLILAMRTGAECPSNRHATLRFTAASNRTAGHETSTKVFPPVDSLG
jgi:hypothetical protein